MQDQRVNSKKRYNTIVEAQHGESNFESTGRSPIPMPIQGAMLVENITLARLLIVQNICY